MSRLDAERIAQFETDGYIDHSLSLHSSRPNTTANSRRGLAYHYMSSQSRWTDPEQPQPDYPLLRGRSFSGCV